MSNVKNTLTDYINEICCQTIGDINQSDCI